MRAQDLPGRSRALGLIGHHATPVLSATVGEDAGEPPPVLPHDDRRFT